MSIKKIALVGNPNSGKTTLYNMLTGSNQYVGNWPGVTVEKKEGKVKLSKTESFIITDLPGIYSLSPYTPEEIIARDYLTKEKPDAIINIIDSTNLERNLYLTTQLMELSIPIVIALNMSDVLEKRGTIIDIENLSKKLGIDIIPISALKKQNVNDIVKRAYELSNNPKPKNNITIYPNTLENALVEIENTITDTDYKNRFFSVKLFEKDAKLYNEPSLNNIKFLVDNVVLKTEQHYSDDSQSVIANMRYNFIQSIVEKCVNKKNVISGTSKIDNIITNKYLAIPIFAFIMFLVYYISISTLGTLASDYINDILFPEIITPFVSDFLTSMNTSAWLMSLILDGIIGGVGAVIGFLPQLIFLFFFLSILEDCGYMSRIAFVLDRIFRFFGLSGKSFIPILIGTGCSVPGIMASRTIENESDRKITIITTSFMPCSAKLPIIALFGSALFNGSVFVAISAYFLGIFSVLISGIILKRLKSFKSDSSPFMMELPSYHLPVLKNVLRQTYDRSKSFIIKAGTVIFLACAVIWFFSSFNFKFEMVSTEQSMLASFGKSISIIFAPLGFGFWEATVATLTGLVAKENIVGTLGVLYTNSEVVEGSTQLIEVLRQKFTEPAALSFMVFNLLCVPCVAAIGAMVKELRKAKLVLFSVFYQTAFAYVAAFLTYNIASLFY